MGGGGVGLYSFILNLDFIGRLLSNKFPRGFRCFLHKSIVVRIVFFQPRSFEDLGR